MGGVDGVCLGRVWLEEWRRAVGERNFGAQGNERWGVDQSLLCGRGVGSLQFKFYLYDRRAGGRSATTERGRGKKLCVWEVCGDVWGLGSVELGRCVFV